MVVFKEFDYVFLLIFLVKFFVDCQFMLNIEIIVYMVKYMDCSFVEVCCFVCVIDRVLFVKKCKVSCVLVVEVINIQVFGYFGLLV